MKKVLISMMFLLSGVLVCQADEPQKFSPEKFQAEMEQFIAKEAGLTDEESAISRMLEIIGQFKASVRSFTVTSMMLLTPMTPDSSVPKPTIQMRMWMPKNKPLKALKSSVRLKELMASSSVGEIS